MNAPTTLAAETPLSPAQRRYFYLTAAVTGAAIMIIEILGAKMLAPYLGTSHFVWTAQIAVTLLALTSGYYLGGRWADRKPRLGSLYLAIIGAALYLCVAVTQVERVAFACLNLRLALGSLLASVFLFFVPLALLAMAGPFLVRMLTSSLQGVGGSMGRLTAISTLGSFAGTLLIGYVLIPLLPNSVTMLLTAAALMLVSAVYLVIWGNRPVVLGVVVAAIGLGGVCGWKTATAGWIKNEHVEEIFRGNSNFGQLQVLQNRHHPGRALFNDFLLQGAYDTESHAGTEPFSYLLHGLATAYTTNISDVLCIGLGIGTVPMQFVQEGARVDVVEINPAMLRVARDYFDFQPERVNFSLGDGRQFVNRQGKQYDAIILDACLGESQPSHLMTREAFAAMRRRLKPDGVLVMNSFGNFASGRDFLAASLERTFTNMFSNVLIYADGEPGKVMNVFFVASAGKLRMERQPVMEQVHPICRAQVAAAFAQTRRVDAAHGMVLTDDYNPAEFYDAANREEMRRDRAEYMRSL